MSSPLYECVSRNVTSVLFEVCFSWGNCKYNFVRKYITQFNVGTRLWIEVVRDQLGASGVSAVCILYDDICQNVKVMNEMFTFYNWS